MDTARKRMLDVSDLTAGYGKRRVLTGVSLNVSGGEIVGVVGHNGAGKTTLLKCIFRMNPIDKGSIIFGDEDISKKSSTNSVSAGMSFTPAERPIFRDLTVMENLELGAHSLKSRTEVRARIDEVVQIFPILGERQTQIAGRFSGGQQRQLSLAMALMVSPKLMLLDEPSLGISPTVVEATFRTIKDLAQERGMSVLIVEQNVKAMTQIADRVYVLRNGEMVLEESAQEASARTDWWSLF
jgi:branched-chain amino acid transport system ATP-binding protein